MLRLIENLWADRRVEGMVAKGTKLCFVKREVIPCHYRLHRRYSCAVKIERSWRRWSVSRPWPSVWFRVPASFCCVPRGCRTETSNDGSTHPWTGFFVGESVTSSTAWTACKIAPEPADRRLFPPVQQHRIITLATQVPTEQGHPITQWSMTDLGRAAVDKGIVPSISPATIWRLLDQAALKPHRWHYWLNSTDPQFDAKMQEIVGLYLQALEMYQRGEILLSVDEKTSIQALERKHPTIQGRAGSFTRIEHEYIRHGTRCLTAGFEVATGAVMGMLTANRPAEVFAEFVQWACDYYAEAPRLHLVVDNLSTHYHTLICQVVADFCHCDAGPLKTGSQRKRFLTDSSKRVVFHFTPTHASWLNQIEIWFSTLTRKVIRRGDFGSLEDLEDKIIAFMDYHNAYLAKPYKWTYTGKPLAVETRAA
jgi:transposase